jgi:aminoglycoside/choline kinase family phosphotransferase
MAVSVADRNSFAYFCAMQHITEAIRELYRKWKGEEPVSLDVLPQSGSERRYFRIYDNHQSFIGTYGANIKENETFVYFTRQFQQNQLAVPEILAVSADKQYYLQEDFGNISLLNKLEAGGFTPPVYDLFKKSLEALAKLQVKGDKGLDYEQCLTIKNLVSRPYRPTCFTSNIIFWMLCASLMISKNLWMILKR